MWLKSGGYLIIDQGEALTAIDVNTGRFVGKKSLEETITKTNLEAAAGGRRAAAPPQHRRHDRRRLHRHGPAAQPREGHARVQRAPAQGPVQGDGHAHLRARPGRDDAQAHARVAAAHADRAVHRLRGQGLHQVAPHGDATSCCASCAGRAIWSRATRCWSRFTPTSRRCWQSTDRPFLEEMEKRLQKRIVVKARGSFHVEDFEIRSPNDKAPIEKSEVAAGGRDDKDGPRDGKRRTPAPAPSRSAVRGRGGAGRGRRERRRSGGAGGRRGGGAQRRDRARSRGGRQRRRARAATTRLAATATAPMSATPPRARATRPRRFPAVRAARRPDV